VNTRVPSNPWKPSGGANSTKPGCFHLASRYSIKRAEDEDDPRALFTQPTLATLTGHPTRLAVSATLPLGLRPIDRAARTALLAKDSSPPI
jgi:hypothetical protein